MTELKLPFTIGDSGTVYDADGQPVFHFTTLADADAMGDEIIEAINTRSPSRNDALEEAAKEAWQELVDKDDRTSPEEYPEMALITFQELWEFMDRALKDRDR